MQTQVNRIDAFIKPMIKDIRGKFINYKFFLSRVNGYIFINLSNQE